MNNKTVPKSLAVGVYLQLIIGIVMMIALAPSSRAGLNGPYTNDFYTLHLWHLQDTNGTINFVTNGVYFYDAQSNNSLVVPLVMSNNPSGTYTAAGAPGPGAPLVPIYGTNYGYVLGISNTDESGLVAPIIAAGGVYPDLSYAETNDSCSFVNTNTGAYTWEAVVQLGFNPTLTDGGDLNTASPEILCTDGGNTTAPGSNPYTVRAVQFRIDCASPSAGQAQLEFNGNISFSPSSQIHDVKAYLPLTGPDAVQQGNWYHVAAAFTGTAPTNGDPADMLTLYWTSFSPSHTNADVLTNFYYFYTVTNTSSHTVFTQPYPSNSIVGTGPFVIGNDNRGMTANGWAGGIAEVRISDCYRYSNSFMFNPLPAPSTPQPTGPVTNTLVGYGQNLNLNLQYQGALPEVTLWYQVTSGVTNLLTTETNATGLVVSNITYAANNESWFAVVTNLYGRTNSAVATVTVGAAVDGLFNTGCGPQNNPLDQSNPGSVDLHWMFPPGGNPYNNSPNCIVWSDAGPLEPNGTVPPNGASVWIGPKANVASAGVTAGTYTFQTTFQVDETLVTATNWISGTFGACGGATGQTLQMFLNGVETDYTLSANPDENAFPFSITNGLQPGSNTLACTVSLAGGDFAAFNMNVTADTGAALTTAPAIVNQPASTTNAYGSTVSFSAVALGAPPLSYYWLSNGVAITPPVWVYTAPPYLSFVATNVSASQLVGTNYFANVQIVFSNFVGSVTSAVATLDVQVPPLIVVSAGVPIWDSTNDQTNIVVYFSGSVDPLTATTIGNYSLNNGASVSSAVLGGAPDEVILTLSSPGLNPLNSYTLTVSNVKSSQYGFVMNPSPALIPVGTYPANLALWVKASVGVTADGSGNVSQWNDLSGNGNNLTDNGYGPPFDPLLITNTFGYPVIHFIGTNGINFNQLQTAPNSTTLAITNDMSVFAVVTFDTLAGNTNGDIISKTANNNIAAPYDYYANSGSILLLRGNGASSTGVASTAPPAIGVPQLLDVIMQGTSVTHRLDGANNGTGTLTAAIGDAGQGVFIGTREDGHNRLTGDINELILVGQALSSSDVASMESYLATEYNLTFTPPINANPTNLVATVTNSVLYLHWPADHTGWQLQAQTNPVAVGLGTNWANYNPSTGTNQVVIPVNLTNGTVFYRLIYTP